MKNDNENINISGKLLTRESLLKANAELIEDTESKVELFGSSRNGYFDTSICSASYHHLPDPTDITLKIMKTLK